MSGLDWFTLSTGIIGLGADIVTLASLTRLGSLTKVTQTVFWIITPVGILYTTIILSFYALRIAVVRYLEAYGTLSEQMLDKIRTGGWVCAQVIGTPLLMLYGISLIISFLGDSDIIVIYILLFLVFGTMGTISLMDVIGKIVEAIYAAFDPNYTSKQYRRKTTAVEQTDKQDI
jgi:hypothetical protein